MLSLIIETNRNNQIASHWVLETETIEEAKRSITASPLLRGNKRIVYTNIDASELAKSIVPGGILYIETAEPPSEKETTRYTELEVHEFENIYPLDVPVEEGSDLIIPLQVAKDFEKRFKDNEYLCGEAGHPCASHISDIDAQAMRIQTIDPQCIAIRITEVEVNAKNKTMRIKAIPHGPRQSVCKLTEPGVKLGYRGFSSGTHPSILSKIVTFDLISAR